MKHFIERAAWWSTSAKEIEEMKAIFEEFVGGDPKKAEKLQELIERAQVEHDLRQSYNDGPC